MMNAIQMRAAARGRPARSSSWGASPPTAAGRRRFPLRSAFQTTTRLRSSRAPRSISRHRETRFPFLSWALGSSRESLRRSPGALAPTSIHSSRSGLGDDRRSKNVAGDHHQQGPDRLGGRRSERHFHRGPRARDPSRRSRRICEVGGSPRRSHLRRHDRRQGGGRLAGRLHHRALVGRLPRSHLRSDGGDADDHLNHEVTICLRISQRRDRGIGILRITARSFFEFFRRRHGRPSSTRCSSRRAALRRAWP